MIIMVKNSFYRPTVLICHTQACVLEQPVLSLGNINLLLLFKLISTYNIYKICPCICQFKTNQSINLFGLYRLENEVLFFHSSLWQALVTARFIFVLLKDSCGNQISAQSAKKQHEQRTPKKENKHRGAHPAETCLQR